MYYTYMLRCKDNSIYTGYTNDINKRMKDHFSKSKNGAKYTKSHESLKLEVVWKSKEKKSACQLEYWIKRLSKMQKEELIKTKDLDNFLGQNIECNNFELVHGFDFMEA